jgi:hypothetical protein
MTKEVINEQLNNFEKEICKISKKYNLLTYGQKVQISKKVFNYL